MNQHHLRLQTRITQFEGSHEQQSHILDLSAGADTASRFAGADWKVTLTLADVPDQPDAVDGCATFSVVAGSAQSAAVALEWMDNAWSRDNFVMLPAAVYNGNRYACRHYRYPPMVHEAEDIGPDAPILITDVPRLSDQDGTPSRLQVLTGDVTTPCITYFAPHAQRAVILLTEQGSAFGNHGLTVEENADRSQATLRIEAPGVRRDTLYTMVNTATPSWDRGAEWTTGTQISIRFRLFIFPAQQVQELFDRFAIVRKDLSGTVALKHELPLSAAFDITEQKHQRENWNEAGYFAVGTHEAVAESRYQDWQVGWVGGGMVTYPFLLAGKPLARERALRNIDWMFSAAQYPSGLFHAVQHQGVSYGDGFDVPGTDAWMMTRKQADALYFLMKTFQLLRAQDANWHVPAHWEAGARRLADLFVRTFRKYGQLGQYLHRDTGDVVVGGSSAAAMVPGALALAGQFFDAEEYSEAAAALADHLDLCDVRAGVTNGGPGEILKCPDSESAFAMLESFVVLYETTGDAHWLERAQAMATQCMTWCASYDYQFPPDSWFGRLDMRAAGSVWANVQNKHSAPGICTLSGDALFKLYRYTGNPLYLGQIQETAHNLTQYLSRADRPVGNPQVMKPGYMCERVNFSDWEGVHNIGGSLFGSCWCEVSLLLTAVEVPGIYVQPDIGVLSVFDHIDAELVRTDGDTAVLRCTNPTAFDADVRVFAERSSSMARILGQSAGLRWHTFAVKAGKTCDITVTAQ